MAAAGGIMSRSVMLRRPMSHTPLVGSESVVARPQFGGGRGAPTLGASGACPPRALAVVTVIVMATAGEMVPALSAAVVMANASTNLVVCTA